MKVLSKFSMKISTDVIFLDVTLFLNMNPHKSYNDESCHSYTLPKEVHNYINHVTHPLSSVPISTFSPEINNFCYIKKYKYRLYFNP